MMMSPQVFECQSCGFRVEGIRHVIEHAGDHRRLHDELDIFGHGDELIPVNFERVEALYE